jgi:peptide chain release factor subunit 1
MKATIDLLRELARLAETDRTVLSAYVSVKRGWDDAYAFIERESKKLTQLLDRKERDYFQTSLSFLDDYLKDKRRQGFSGPGVAFFADLGADFVRGVELVSEPEPLLAVDDEAIVYPLALQLDEYEPIGVIMIDASCSRILIVAGQVIDDMDSFCKNVHHLSKVGGWSQMRYQRRRAKQIKRFAQDTIENAQSIFASAGIKRIVIAGRDRMVTALEQEFPSVWKNKVVATVRWDLDALDQDFVRRIRPLLEKAERDEESNLLQKLVAELRRAGLAVAGVEPTLKALNMGQVDTLFLSEELDLTTKEELTSRAQATAAHVESIPEANKVLRGLGGAAALLRFKIKP